ncbi:protein EFR3 cmp44E isoform X4 [Aphis craccivora]|uniref:Protein EFR3 cmp44E isoform X4 n=1 Tax=Aphis craccivora TaxID=307492 RepID=A0A6G0ZPE9_APHCR|nr:protein EFR3 cmp44E isoform X4 [Aphis craccivora]
MSTMGFCCCYKQADVMKCVDTIVDKCTDPGCDFVPLFSCHKRNLKIGRLDIQNYFSTFTSSITIVIHMKINIDETNHIFSCMKIKNN